MELFIENWNNCATIACYQFIQASHLSYPQFKKMIATVSSNPNDKAVLDYLEPTIKKYWKEKDPHKFPSFANPQPFEGDNKNTKDKCTTCVPWSNDAWYEDCDNEYACFDFLGRLLLRVMTCIDVESPEYKHSLTELWNRRKHRLSDEVKTKQLNKYIKYMSKYTKTIPLIVYELIYLPDGKTSDYHIVCLIREGPNNYIDLNSNLQPKNVRLYNAFIIRRTSGNWNTEPPHKVLENVKESINVVQ